MAGDPFNPAGVSDRGGSPLDIVRTYAGRGTGDTNYVTRDGRRWEPYIGHVPGPTGTTLGEPENGRMRIIDGW